jgi:hypothetical protein
MDADVDGALGLTQGTWPGTRGNRSPQKAGMVPSTNACVSNGADKRKGGEGKYTVPDRYEQTTHGKTLYH